ncbi:hypothetical protein ILYODFUR_013489 [Ilyodon furcidens]|uniref:Uncharacterized protein n=1 Tax=Ilyodon furcidens TaxID=33524 RepID=A0ABV0V2V2_9TELE
MLGSLGGAGEVDTEEEEDEEEGGSRREFDDPLCTLVKNCNMLHNIVGPACIFLRQGFAQSQLVCMTLACTCVCTHSVTTLQQELLLQEYYTDPLLYTLTQLYRTS